jgi:hypothetical protein
MAMLVKLGSGYLKIILSFIFKNRQQERPFSILENFK